MDELKFVFDDEDKKWVEASRTVTDITTLAVKIKNRGVHLVWKLEFMEFSKTMISKYNIHNNELRCISEETAHLEMFVAYNGPEIGESDKLLSEALIEHFMPKGWHFVTHNALYSDGGKTAGRILKKKSCLPFFQ